MTDTPHMDAAEARRLVDADKARRVQAAAEQVAALLREAECDLVAVPQITPDGRITAMVQIVAR